jgi:protein-L-isoaspartate(D-aspartate) O-methyltransferase
MVTQMSFEDPTGARELRTSLVEQLVAAGDLQVAGVRDALLRVPRHLFVPPHVSLEEAYANRPGLIGHEQTISQPAIVARMTEALELCGTERVLEIGTGSGYQTAVLSLLASEVFSVEFFPELAKRASVVLAELGYSNVRVRAGDGTAGWPEDAPFDRIIATAAARRVPPAWLAQLGDRGVLVAPVDARGGQELVRLRNNGGGIERESLGLVRFVPLLSRTDATAAYRP